MADIDFTPESGDVGFRPAVGQPSGYTGMSSGSRDLGDQSREMAERVSQQASRTVESGKQNVAGGMSRMGDKLDDVASNLSQHGELGARAAGVVRGASDALDSGADYVRSSSLSHIRDDLTNQIRSHPLLSMGVAIGAGYLLSKILD